MEQVNRVDLTIKQEMLEILASIKGKTLKSIEGEYLTADFQLERWKNF